MKLKECKRILVVKPSSLGDIIHTLPAVEAVHRAVPDAKIDWLVSTDWSDLLEDVTFLDRLISFPREEFRGLSGGLKAVSWAKRVLQQTHYDLTIDFQGLFRSALLSRLSKTSRVMGFQKTREGASLFYDEKVMIQDWSAVHAVDRNLALAKAAGADILSPNFGLPKGDPVDGLTSMSDKPTVLLHPFSRGEGKSLSTDEVIELADQLAPTPIILVGMFEGNAPGMWPDNITDLLGKTSLPQLIHLIRLCSWTVSIDSGPMHLAAGITDRVLSLHTWSNPAMVGPWPKSSWAYREGEIVQVVNLTSDRFPERRDLKSVCSKKRRLFKPADIETITSFLRMQLAK